MKTARFALVIAEPPPGKALAAQKQAWREFLATVAQNAPVPAGTICLHDNVWQIALDNGLPFLYDLNHWGQAAGVPMRVLFLEEEPTWITYPG